MNNEKMRLKKAVEEFSHEMIEKLWKKYDEGVRGWDSPDRITDNAIKILLSSHVAELNIDNTPQEVDVANLAMMLWYRRKARA